MRTPTEELDIHFRPQVHQCDVQSLASRGLAYTHLRVEEMGRWYRRFVCMLGLQSAVSSSFVHRGEALLALRQMSHPAETEGRRLRDLLNFGVGDPSPAVRSAAWRTALV